MSTIGEDSSYVHNYIEDKKDLENEGWNVRILGFHNIVYKKIFILFCL